MVFAGGARVGVTILSRCPSPPWLLVGPVLLSACFSPPTTPREQPACVTHPWLSSTLTMDLFLICCGLMVQWTAHTQSEGSHPPWPCPLRTHFRGRKALCTLAVKSGSTPVGGPVKSGRKRTRTEVRFGQRLARAGVATNWIQRQGQWALIPCVGSGQTEIEMEMDKERE